MPVITCPQCGANWRVPLGAGLHVVAKCLKCGHRFELDTEVTRETGKQRPASTEPGAPPPPGIAPTIWLERSGAALENDLPSGDSGQTRPRRSPITKIAVGPGVSRALKIAGWILLFAVVVALMFLFVLLKP